MSDSLDARYFDDVYNAHDDPWEFETSDYEKGKYAHTLRSLPRDHYLRAFEIGCSIGVLTEQLAQRCEALLSVDVAEKALEKARLRCRDLPQVRFQKMSVPAEFPDGPFDLVLVSEVAYYFDRPDLERLADKIAQVQDAESDLLLVHFTPVVEDYPSAGDDVHDYFLARPEWRRLEGARADRYRIDVLRRKAK